jgi:ferredoxin/menaquinone-dependent protoporphyrinogen IX oxidase
MNIKNIAIVSFSPTGTTQKVLGAMAQQLAAPATFHDFTPFHQEYPKISLDQDDLLVIGTPVYSGRVPPVFVERLEYLEGHNAQAIMAVTYGNRDYDDALLELKNLLRERGFVPVAAAAFVTEHNVYRALAAGRPDADDLREIAAFAKHAAACVQHGPANGCDLPVKGNKPYRQYVLPPIQPHSTKKCSRCGLCATRCPGGAIPMEAPEITNKDDCICCMACISQCPQKARQLSMIQKIGAWLHLSKYSARREHEYFFLDK